MAAGALIITEAGGLVGNFTGEPDYLYQREILAGTPRIYGQLVKTLAQYTRVITDDNLPEGEGEEGESDPEDEALLASLQAAEDAARDEKVAAEPKRIRITANKPADAAGKDDAPF